MVSFNKTSAELDAVALAALLGVVEGDGQPLYRALCDGLRRIISDGAAGAGSRLPPERALSNALGVSRVTVTSAYKALQAQGWAEAVHGAGTFVAIPVEKTSWGAMMRAESPGVLDFVNAAPEASPFLSAAFTDALTTVDSALAGHGYAPSGTHGLRTAIAARYTERGSPTHPDQIVVTSGAGDAAHLAFETFARPGNRVLIEHPTYPGAVEALESVGALAVPVPVDAADPDAFVDEADRAARQNAPTLAYLMPDFSNPTGARMTATGRRRLSATMARHGILTIVDEVAADLVLDGSPMLEPFGVPAPGTATISIGSLSKTVWGGLRVGWVRSDRELVARMARTYAKRQLSVSILEQAVALHVLARYDDVLAARRTWLQGQRDLLVSHMRADLPGWTFRVPDGGLSLWCSLPEGITSEDVVRRAATQNLLLARGTRFGTGYAFDDRLRLPFTRPAVELGAAVRVLAETFSGAAGEGHTVEPAEVVV
ncbi:PLP-dependent aminotransferase family protein [Rhodococcus sp. G-MC3]|uniref:MocR-like transcription factor YczR n=1 Tax=Rhodococcus sp. G-MC3 TaxID=3046209 RepID=UPI0024B89684|nr:PLP-dependent aminotransferase family protein [Rhodococcus sp. G-MC3]MDJ0395219.1 PLP-dependent aminotransferase family protein [Rhodococcus sp. G-MC3]